MDWELKTSTSDFTESGREDDARLAEVVGSSSSGVSKNAGGFSVDLKLGGLGDLGEGSAEKLEEPRRRCTMVSSSSGSSKRTRATNGTQNVLCIVDGCAADLSKCRDYHRRHRVCERHSKTPVVLVGGKELRFCQQCSRFQSLGEFDGEKRSCRKRLDGHNRRRRKPHEDPFMSSGSSFLSNHQGARLVQFGGPQSSTTPAAADIVPTWPTVGKQHRQLHVTDHRQSAAPSSLLCVYNGGDKRFPFLLGNDPAERSNQRVPEVTICHGLVDDYCYVPADSSRISQKKSSSAGLAQPINSKRALSLLSTHSAAQSSSSGMGMDGHLVQFSRSQGTERRSPIPRDNDNLCNEIFEEVAPDNLLEKGISHARPFSSWK